MNYLDLQNQLSDRLAEFATKVEGRCAQGNFDLPSQADDLVAGLLRELLGFRNLRNANRGGRAFPAVDLVDDERRIAFQVTATTSLEKIKATVDGVLRHDLDQLYPELRVFVLTRRQDRYSDEAIAKITNGRLAFRVNEHTWDFRDLLRMASKAGPIAYKRAIDLFDAYERGALVTFAEADFDPPDVHEAVELNLMDLFVPRHVFIADLIEKPVRRANGRKHLRGVAEAIGRRIPSDFEVFEGKLLTFYDLEAGDTPFADLYDPGTATRLGSSEFPEVDVDHERVFKSLLRLTLQQQLYKERIHWRHEEGLFVFMPRKDGDWTREETWFDRKSATRNVVLYKASKKHPDRGGFRHLAFQTDFIRGAEGWLIAIRPDWYFSTNPDFRPSPIAANLLKGLKRLENNKAVEQHFRFIAHWLRAISEGDLLSSGAGFLSFGEVKSFDNHPALDDERWLPYKPDLPEIGAVGEMSELLKEDATPHA